MRRSTAEVPGQVLRGHPADVRDVQPEEHPEERLRLRPLNRFDGVPSRDLPVAVELLELVGGQTVEVGHRAEEPLFPEPADELLPDPLDVHRSTHPVDERLEAARGTRAVGAAVHDLALRLDDVSAAKRAFRRHLERLRPLRVRQDGADHLRNDVARTLDDHHVALANVFPIDVLLVVERGRRHRDAAHVHRFQLRPRVQVPRPPDTDVDLRELGLRRQGGPLEGASPTRPRVESAKPPLLVHRVDFDHDPVDLVVQVDPPRLPGPAGLRDLLDRLEALGVRVRAKAALAKPLEELPLRLDLDSLPVARAVDPDCEWTRGRDRRVELSEGPGRSIARIRSRFLSLRDEPLVQLAEPGKRKIDLTAYLHHRRRRFPGRQAKRERDRPDGPQVDRDLLSAEAVTPSGPADEAPLLVHERDG